MTAGVAALIESEGLSPANGLQLVEGPLLSPADLVEPALSDKDPTECGRTASLRDFGRRWTEAELVAAERKLTSYLKEQVALLGRVPTSPARPDKPFTSKIAATLAIPLWQLSSAEGSLRSILDDFVKTHGLQKWVPCAPPSKALVGYLDDLAGAKLPIPSKNGSPNMAAIARGAGMGKSTLTKEGHPNNVLVWVKFEELGGGTEAPKRAGSIVLDELLTELEGRTLRPQLAIYRRSLPQLRHAVKFAKGLHALAGEAEAIEALQAASAAADKADIRSRLTTCIKIVERINEDGLLPVPLADRIRFLCRRANIAPDTLFMESGAGWAGHDWLGGRSAPDRFMSYGPVRMMEKILAKKTPCSQGTLWNSVRYRASATGKIPKQFWPLEIPNNVSIRKEVKLLLPDDILVLPDEERHHFFLLAYGVVLAKREKNVDKNHAANCADPYRYKSHQWHEALICEWERLLQFHTAKRVVNDSGDNDTQWVKGTRERNMTFVEKTMGAILKTRPHFPENDLGLALLVVPTILSDTVEFARGRRNSVTTKTFPDGIKPYGAEDTLLYVFAKAMVAKGGFLRQRPEFYDCLNPEARAMLAAEFPEAIGDWVAICEASEERYAARISNIDRWIVELGPQTSRQKARVVQILDNDLDDFRNAFGNILVARLAKCEPGYRAWSYAVQNLVYHEMVAQFPHRSRAITETTYLPDNSGGLRYLKGEWWWYVHWSSIKNGRKSGDYTNSDWFKGKLDDTNGLYNALHDYTRNGGARDWILNGKSSDSLFVTRSKNPNLDAQKLYKKVQASTLWVLYQIADERWADVRDFGVHRERQMVFNKGLAGLDGLSFEKAFLERCSLLGITARVAGKSYLHATPGVRATGVVAKLAKERADKNGGRRGG